MNYIVKTIFYLIIFVFSISGNCYQIHPAMRIKRGLENAITGYTKLEQKLARIVAAKLEKKGFPVHEITRVHFRIPIQSLKEYYNRNDITFFVNPVVSGRGKGISTTAQIGIGWTDPSVINLPDGGIEFEVGRKVNAEDLILDLYAVSDSYNAPVKNQDAILEKINAVFMDSDIDAIKHLTNKNLYELANNYSVDIRTTSDNQIFDLSIRTLETRFADEDHTKEIEIQYVLEANLREHRLKLIKRYYPSLYPTPIHNPYVPKDGKSNN